MLPDHYLLQERQVGAARRRRRCVRAYGDWLEGLANWSWFLTVTFRTTSLLDELREGTEPEVRDELQGVTAPEVPWSRTKRLWVMKRLEIYFLDLRQAAGRPIGWVIAEELGDFGLRFHVHALVSGVEELLIPTWQKTAFRRFGISEIKRFHLGIGAGHYIAKHALDESGGLHFGGTLARDARMPNYPEVGRNVIVHSPNLPSEYFRLTLGKRRKR